MTTNFELATKSASYFITCKELGLLTIEELRGDELWFNHPDIVLDYMQESAANKAEMVGLIGRDKYQSWIVAFFDKYIQRTVDRNYLYPYVDFLEVLKKTKEGLYPGVEDILSFFFTEIRHTNLAANGVELAYILDNFEQFLELAKPHKQASMWSRLQMILLENPQVLLKFANQCSAHRNIVHLWESSILEDGEENIANHIMVRAISRGLDLDELKTGLMHWVNNSRDKPISADYYGQESSHINESLDRFVSNLDSFGVIKEHCSAPKPVTSEEDLLEHFSDSDKMTFDSSFDIFIKLFNKDDDLLGLVDQLSKLKLDHYTLSNYQDFSHIYTDYVQSLYKSTDFKVKALAHLKMRVRFGSNFSSVDHVFGSYIVGQLKSEKTEKEILDFVLQTYHSQLIEGTPVFAAFRNLFRETDTSWEVLDLVDFIGEQIQKYPESKTLERGLLNLFRYKTVKNIQGCIGLRSGILDALLDLRLKRATGYNKYSVLVENFMSYADLKFKTLVGMKAKQISMYTPDQALACLRAVVMESQIIEAYCFSETTYEYPLQWIRSNPQVLEEAYNTAMEVKGGYDAAKYVGNKYAMIYFGSKRAKKNLFQQSKTFDTFLSYLNTSGLSGIGNANPFEKGFSWGQYEEFCKHLDVVAFSTSQVSWKKRLVAYFFANMFNDAPDVVEKKVKLALGAEMTLKKVAAAVVRQISALDDFNESQWSFKSENIASLRGAIQDYWKKSISEVSQCAFFMLTVGVTGKMPKPGMLKIIFNAIKDQGAANGAERLLKLSENSEYCAQAYQNKTSLDVIVAAIDYANSVKKPEQKEIVLAVQDDESGIVGRTLEAGDMRALSIGDEINCCQYVTGHAHSCAKATYTETDFGVFVVEPKDKPGSKPLAESAIWLSDNKNVIVIDSIEGQRKDSVSYEKIANIYYKAILQWIAQGKMVCISNTEYGLTVQVRRKIFAKLKNTPRYEKSPTMRSMTTSVYSDLGSYAYYITDKDI